MTTFLTVITRLPTDLMPRKEAEAKLSYETSQRHYFPSGYAILLTLEK